MALVRLGSTRNEAQAHFPRRRLARRIFQDTESAMGTFWLLILTPIAAAALATFLATSQPPEFVRHGVVIGPSSLTNLGLAIGGGAGGVFAVGAVTFLVLLVRYLRSGDRCGTRPVGARALSFWDALPTVDGRSSDSDEHLRALRVLGAHTRWPGPPDPRWLLRRLR